MLLSRIKQSTLFENRVYYRSHIAQCTLCLEPSSRNICPGCEEALPRLTQYCPQCAEPNDHGHLCATCLTKRPHFDQVISPYLLVPPITTIIMSWKEHPKHLGSEILIYTLTNNLLKYEFDAIVYVPYHWKRLLKRGRNPVRELSQYLANNLQLPLLDIIKRPVQKHTQKGLNRRQRQRNLRGAFDIRSFQMSNMKLLLIDDVVTTGATCNEISRLLKNKGAKSVTVACLARTPLKA